MRVALVVVMMLLAPVLRGATNDAVELRQMLDAFLVGASKNDAAAHDRFWAEDLIYTGSSGRRVGKADIMSDVRSAPVPKAGDPVSRYSAEDVRIQQYGTTAVVAFRLVAETESDGRKETLKFHNSGMFLKRKGRWQVANWQATKIPDEKSAAIRDDEAAITGVVDRAYVQGVHAAFNPVAMREGMHESFVMFVATADGVTKLGRDAWIERMSAAPAPAEGKPSPVIRGDIDVLDLDGNAAVARVHLWRDGKQVFTDYISLYRFADGWKMVGKTFVRK